jgi:metal-responsive CopG/Arc/MetJ family transcriptional regulator
MRSVKTTISIEKNLFDQADKMARTMNVSRSKLFVVALQDFLEHQKNKEMLAQINEAYAEEADATEQTMRRKLGRQQKRLVVGDW